MATSQTVATLKRPTVTQQLAEARTLLDASEGQIELLHESLTNAVAMLRQEDAGWSLPGSDGTYRGLRLIELKHWSEQIRASLSGTAKNAPNPHMRNGLMLRHSFIWDGGMHYGGVPGSKDTPTRQGKTNVQQRIDALDNQRNFFGDSAHRRREAALYSDGLYLAVGLPDKKIRPIPLHEITATHRSKLYEDEIVAYRWSRNESIDGGPREYRHYWIFVDWYDEKIPDLITYSSDGGSGSGSGEQVLKDHVAFDLHANRPDGAAFGSPDAISALIWARIIRDLIMNGVKMQDALAMFAFKATSPSRAGQQATALELGKPSQSGSAAALGGDNDLVPLNSAGKGYDFGSIGFIVATMAASLHVSGIALSANTALAGSSYGAAKTLDLPGRMAMETRRREHVEYEARVLRWMNGGPTDAKAYFDNFDDATDEYRSVQSAMLAWTTGTLSPEGFRDELEIVYGRKLSGKIPPGTINPNTETQADRNAAAAASLTAAGDAGQLTTKAPVTAGAGGANTPATKTTPAANQGKSSGAGSTGHANDLPVKTK